MNILYNNVAHDCEGEIPTNHALFLFGGIMTQTVSIMGAEYKVIIGVSPEEDKALDGRYGYCQPTSRLIVIADMDKIPSWDGESEEDKKAAIIVTLRHEVLHAFLRIVRIEMIDGAFHYGAVFIGMPEMDAARIEVYQTVEDENSK